MCATQCDKCQRHGGAPPKEANPTWKRPRAPRDTFHSEFAVPIDRQAYLVKADAFSKWLEVRAVRHLTSSTLISESRRILATFGIPHKAMQDNGAAFVSQDTHVLSIQFHYGDYQQCAGYRHHPVTNQCTNGPAERMVQQLKKALAK